MIPFSLVVEESYFQSIGFGSCLFVSCVAFHNQHSLHRILPYSVSTLHPVISSEIVHFFARMM
jgi:hypothetical protein